MGGNFPAGTRERRDRRERKRNFDTRGRPDKKTKIRREPDETLKSLAVIIFRFFIKFLNLLKTKTLISRPKMDILKK